jgi:hypothetical protein
MTFLALLLVGCFSMTEAVPEHRIDTTPQKVEVDPDNIIEQAEAELAPDRVPHMEPIRDGEGRNLTDGPPPSSAKYNPISVPQGARDKTRWSERFANPKVVTPAMAEVTVKDFKGAPPVPWSRMFDDPKARAEMEKLEKQYNGKVPPKLVMEFTRDYRRRTHGDHWEGTGR